MLRSHFLVYGNAAIDPRASFFSFAEDISPTSISCRLDAARVTAGLRRGGMPQDDTPALLPGRSRCVGVAKRKLLYYRGLRFVSPPRDPGCF